MTKKVCHITTLHSVNDNRIFYKECISLKNNGYNVYLMCSGTKSKIKQGINIIGLPKYKNRVIHFFRVSFFSVIIKAIKVKASIYHFHDPELIFSGLLLRLLGKKVIYDVHENNPYSILSKPYLRNKFFKKIVSNLLNFLEKFSAYFFSKIVTARPDISERFLYHKPITLLNYPIVMDNQFIKPLNFKKEKKSVIYVGGLSEIRGIKELIMAFNNIKKAELWLLGPWDSEKFKKTCEKLEGWSNTRYLGKVKPFEIFDYLENADIGIITFHPYPNHIKTLATKPFEYMLAGLPMIMSDFDYWKAFFKDLPLYVDPKNPVKISKIINELLLDPKKMENLGKESKEQVLNEYNWNLEQKKLLKLYYELIEK